METYPHGEYTTSSAYEAQFHTSTPSDMERLIWKTWAPPKCKFFSWIAYQNRLWTADRLTARGWSNQKVCVLCHMYDETLLHLLSKCRYTTRLWDKIFDWAAMNIPPRGDWSAFSSISEWWSHLGSMPGMPRKGFRSLIILVSWEVWKERNGRIFQRNFKSLDQLLCKIKDEVRCWTLAGAKHLGALCPSEE